MEFLPRPLRDDSYRGRRRELVALRLAAEVDFYCDVAASVAMNVAATVEFEHLQRKAGVDRLVPVYSFLNFLQLSQGIIAFADENQDLALLRPNEARTNQNIPEDLTECGINYLGFRTFAVNKKLQFLIRHVVSPLEPFSMETCVRQREMRYCCPWRQQS